MLIKEKRNILLIQIRKAQPKIQKFHEPDTDYAAQAIKHYQSKPLYIQRTSLSHHMVVVYNAKGRDKGCLVVLVNAPNLQRSRSMACSNILVTFNLTCVLITYLNWRGKPLLNLTASDMVDLVQIITHPSQTECYQTSQSPLVN